MERKLVRSTALAYVLAALLCAGRAYAQTCTLGPYCQDASCPGGAGSQKTVAEINTIIDGAADSAVVCLRRAQQWSGNLDLSGTGHPDGARVTVCSSDDTQCTIPYVGGANARVNSTSGSALGLEDGFTVT